MVLRTSRIFTEYLNAIRKCSVREYQTRHIGNGVQMQSEEEGLQILEYLCRIFRSHFQIREMEQELKKNAYLLEKRAKEQFGKSVQELLEEVRIQIACSYLSATDRAVTQISSDVGFGSISSFQRSFCKIHESDTQ
ncbi:MAG: helix-turn-helix domain-containing protein [Mediterraneibacter gnavus]